MIQCYGCEGWYHSKHLLPPILNDYLDEEFIVICRNCLASSFKIGMVLPYLDYFEKGCLRAYQSIYKAHIELCNPDTTQTPCTKRKRLNEAGAAQATTRLCLTDRRIKFLQETAELDLIIDVTFAEVLCKCDECQRAFAPVLKLIHAIENRDDDM